MLAPFLYSKRRCISSCYLWNWLDFASSSSNVMFLGHAIECFCLKNFLGGNIIYVCMISFSCFWVCKTLDYILPIVFIGHNIIGQHLEGFFYFKNILNTERIGFVGLISIIFFYEDYVVIFSLPFFFPFKVCNGELICF